ncbi:MAG: alpha/beta hydrolase [Proteobacteria bacterium]|nr:alpha/beta hydrolase [Pseudomonadota bacterium]
MEKDTPRFLTLADGRKLCFQEYGDPQGHPVVYAHGAPSCRLEGAIFAKDAAQRGLRLIATDRPGFGQSDFLPGRQWTDYVKDVEQLTAHLGIGNFGHIGWSGGGPPTYAVAHYIPERLDFAISLAGQPGLEDPEDKKLLSKADQVAVSLLHTSPFFFRSFFNMMSAMDKLTPKLYYNSFTKSSGPDDARILNKPEVREWFSQVEAEAFRQGGKGVSWDAEIDYTGFGFRAQDVTYPVHVFQGDQDNYVPYDLQKKFMSNMPNSVWHDLPGRGHFFPVEMTTEIMDLAKSLLQ